MFYRPKQHLKAQLEERLRTALDFATLGSHEPERIVHSEAPRGPEARVFLFAKVSPPCPHSPDPSGSCDASGAHAFEHRSMTVADSAVGTRRRIRRSRRGGAAQAAPQPCTWADPRS